MPSSSDTRNRVIALLQQGSVAAARDLSIHWCDSAPEDLTAWSIRASIHGQLTEYSQAEHCYRRILERQPDTPEALCYLGLSLVFQGKQQDALATLVHTVRVAPRFAAAFMHLGCLQRDMGDMGSARQSLEHALTLDPGLDGASVYLGNILQHRGDFEGAEQRYQQVLSRHPYHPDALAGLASVREHSGDVQGAEKALEPLIRKGLLDASAAFTFAAIAPELSRIPEALDHVTAALSRPSLSPKEKGFLHYAAANLHDKQKETASAMQHLNTANRQWPQDFDHETYSELLRHVRSVFKKPPQTTVTDNNSPTPVFIVGMPRSGTTLVEQIISSHRHVQPLGELGHIGKLTHIAPELLGVKQPYPECLKQVTPDQLRTLRAWYLDQIPVLPEDATHFTDKMPANFERLGLIRLLFPDAPIIHCRRNPVDTCLSCYFQNFGTSNIYANNLTDLGRVYREYRSLMTFWKKQIELFDIDYEHLVENQETDSRALLDWCGLEWDDNCLQFHKLDRAVQTASYQQVRQPMYTASVEKWRRYEEHLAPLLKELGKLAD